MHFSRVCALSVVAMILAGCQNFEANRTMYERDRPASDTEVAAIVSGARDFLFDPYSVRDAEISRVVTASTSFGPASIVCVRANAKNRYGAYTGRQTYAINLSQSGQIVNVSQDVFARNMCSQMRNWRRFTGLGKLRNL